MNSDKFYKIILKVWEVGQKPLIAGLKAYLNTVVGQGILLKFINFAVDNLFEQIIDPVLKVALIKIGYKYDVKNGERLIEKLRKAEEDGNAEEYDHTVDVILGGGK